MMPGETSAAPARKDRPGAQRKRIGRPFAPKNAGKPRGTRDRRTLVGVEVCEAMAARAADRLAKLIDSRSSRIAFEASRLVLFYAWGAPTQRVEIGGAFGDLARELGLALADARQRRAALDGPKTLPPCTPIEPALAALDVEGQQTAAFAGDGQRTEEPLLVPKADDEAAE